ncbi:MAG TPA: putative quinol monooxygenase [Candidatus Limnocylindria bacterium]|nr:putative quinol monooxygenase [Candidatus Limnocylindria bacterium]
MPFVVTATWRAKPGQEEAVRALLGRVAAASRDEPGCRLFWTHRSTEDPLTFFLYEQYESEAAFRDHAASEHVRTIVLEDAVHRLDERRRATFTLMDDATAGRTDDVTNGATA